VVHGRARLPTRHGEFAVVSFAHPDGTRVNDVALVRGDVTGQEQVPTRLHSECVTGDVFGSIRCDCRDQLELALERLGTAPVGLVLYLRQEGRGIGIADKVRAYALQDAGLDTVDANLHLGFDDDLRTYEGAAAMLAALQVHSIVLYTNNPRKLEGLRTHGVEIAGREPIVPAPRPENARYLTTKRDRSGHLG
jgi:GTP cyclohydrolase II